MLQNISTIGRKQNELQGKMKHRINTTIFVLHAIKNFRSNGWRWRAESHHLTPHDFILWAYVITMGVLGRRPTLMNKHNGAGTADAVTPRMPRSLFKVFG
jgi:hypothetical protein